jgi:hypothetical protein
MIIIEIIIGLIMAYLMKQILDVQQERYEERQKEIEPIKIFVEIINENYYAWLHEENKFIMQSKSKEDFIEELKKMFPNQNLNLLSKEKIAWHQENKN